MQDKRQKEVQESNSDVFQNAFSLRVVAKMALQIAVVVGGMIVGAVYLGRYLDGVFGTAPWLTAILALGSTFPAFYITYKLGTRAITQSEPDFERWKQKRSASPVQPVAPAEGEAQV